jgi:outer membrane protein TolC
LTPAVGQQQPTPQATPAIPPAEQPTATPGTEPQLPSGPKEETKPMIPSVASPTPSPTPTKAAVPSDVAARLDQEFQEALEIHRVRPSFFAPLSLLDAVRLALMQNSDLRMSGEDAQLARGALKTATGLYDTTVAGVGGYTKTYIYSSNTATQEQVTQEINQTLVATLEQLRLAPASNIGQLVNSNALKANLSASADSVQSVLAGFYATKTLRNGVDLSVDYSPEFVDSQDHLAWPPPVHEITFTVGVSLTKFGTYFNSADETAARKDYQASLLTMGHAATKTVFDTVQAYWKEAAALEKFYIADRSFRVNETILRLTEEMAKNDAASRTDVSLATAHRAQAFAARSTALIAVLNAAKDLASTLGLRLSQIHLLPFPSDRFPSVSASSVDSIDLSRLTDAALVRRMDRLAALATLEGKRVLADKARIDLRPDLKFSVGAGGALIDDRQVGIGGGHSGYSLEPTFNANLALTFKGANNKKEGALLEAQANLNKSILGLEDVSRDIALSVQNDVDAMRENLIEIEQSVTAEKNFVQSLSDIREKFRSGAATLLDTFQAETSLDTSASALADARSNLADLIAKLRFDTATMLAKDTALRTPSFPNTVEKFALDRQAFVSLPDLSKEAGPAVMDRNYEPNIKYISGRPPWHH